MPCPYLTLGVPENATSEQIRQAYLVAAREHPPDRDPRRFQEIHEAYEHIKDEVARAHIKLFGLTWEDPDRPLADLIPTSGEGRRRIGIERWIQAGLEQARIEPKTESSEDGRDA